MEFAKHNKILVHQLHETLDLVAGLESRNKYEILDQNLKKIGFAVENGKGVKSFLLRNTFGFFRNYEILFYNQKRELEFIAHSPVRLFFTKYIIHDPFNKPIGEIQQKFSVFSRSFEVSKISKAGTKLTLTMEQPIFSFWTFKFRYKNEEVAKVEKKWSGLLSEVFTDKDKFLISFEKNKLDEAFKKLIVAASVFIDIQYFENNHKN